MLAACLLLTALGTLTSLRVVKQLEYARAELAADHDLSRLESRLSAYLALLRATRAFVEAEGSALNARRFETFVSGLRITRDYPGIQGIGWSPKVRPDGSRFEIRFLVPQDDRNRAALGFDMHSEPVRAAAMDRARDLGAPAMSGSVVLKQEIHPDKSRGFLIYEPLYEGAGVPATLEARREQLLGFVYAPFRSVDFFDGVFREDAVKLRSIRVTGQQGDAASLLYGDAVANDENLLERRAEFAGQRWTLLFEHTGNGLSRLERSRPVVVLLLGLLITALLFALTRAQAGERRRAEERTAEMRRQVQFAELLLGIVSHDLRNPLHVIKLNAELLERVPLNDECARCIRRIQASGDMSLRMVRDLLDFTQARLTGGIPVLRTPGDFIDIVRQAVEEVKAAHPDREIVLSTSGDGSGVWDADRIAQVASNLLNNAVVYGAADAPVTVSVSAEGKRVKLRIHNEGEPIAPDLQAVLFEPLQQGPSRRGVAERNIGLGLYIVQQIARAHGGTVECRSAPAEGTTFTVDLPRAAE